MCPRPRLMRTLALLKATLDRVQALFSIRGTRPIAPFSTRITFWRGTAVARLSTVGYQLGLSPVLNIGERQVSLGITVYYNPPAMERAALSIRWLLILIVFVWAFRANAQSPTTPNLAGIWSLNLLRSRTVQNDSSISESMTIICAGQSIQLEETLKSGGHKTRTYIVDGKEHLMDETRSGSITSRGYSTAVWNGSTLVIDYRAHLDDPDNPNIVTPDSHLSQRWNMSADRRVLTLTIEGLGTKRVLVYNKR